MRILAAAAILFFAEGTGVACSCITGGQSVESQRFGARQMAVSAAIVARFEVVEPIDFAAKRGELVRPIQVYVGEPQPLYRLAYSDMSTCGSTFEKDRIAALYHPDKDGFEWPEQQEEFRLVEDLEEALTQPRSRRRLTAVRAAIAARRPDAPEPVYSDPGLCNQFFLNDPGVIRLIQEEAANAGRKVYR